MTPITRPTRTRRPLLAVAALAAATLVVAGCSSSGSGASAPKSSGPTYDPKAPVTITWWTGQTADAEKLLENLAAEYHKAHPNVTIQVSPGGSTTDDLLQKVSAGFVSGTFPDLSYAFGSWATQLGQSGHTLDITKAVTAPAAGWNEIPEAARKTATVDGKIIGIPALVDNLGLLYNKTVFDNAGVPYPTADWSWDDFRAAAKKLTDPDKKIFGATYSVSGSEDTTWHLWPLLWQRGGKILSDDGKSAAFNSDAGVAALDSLRAMAVDDKSMYLDQTDEKYPRLFQDGRIAMMMSGPWELYDLNTKKVSYGVVPLPGYNGDHETVSGPDVWVAFDHHDVNRAGATTDFLLWLTASAQDVRWNLAYGNLPLRSSESTTPEFAAWAKTYSPGAQAFFDNLANAKQARPTVPGYVEMSKYVGEAISKVLQGAATSKDALDQAARQSADALDQ
jgi:multiple sugar transport system substrate-binding protein